MNRLSVFLLSLMLASPLLAAEGFSSLEEQMTGQEFNAAGLDKLSPQELATLNEWIRRRSLATIDAPAATAASTSAAEPAGDQRGFRSKSEEEDRSPIHSRIVGKFTGWDGQSVFKLENGMIWAQKDKDKFYVREIENPEVTINPGMFGTWRLKVNDYNSTCRVERIQ